MADLVTTADAQAALAGGGLALGPPQVAALPPLVAAASRAVRKHCNRYFSRSVFDGLYTVENPSTWVLTREYPVNTILRAATDPTVVLTIANLDSTTNQRAYCSLVQTAAPGDMPDLPAPVTGLKVVRVASGAVIVNEGGPATLLFATYPTVQTLADAVTALGQGWRATVTAGFGGWPTADPEHTGLCYFRPNQQTVPALGSGGAGLIMHTQDLNVTYAGASGDVNLAAPADDLVVGSRFGDVVPADPGDAGSFGGYQGVRLIYDAGMDVIFEDVRQAVIETVAYWLTTAGGIDQALVEEKIGSYEYKLDAKHLGKYGLPASAVGKLSYYRNNRC